MSWEKEKDPLYIHLKVRIFFLLLCGHCLSSRQEILTISTEGVEGEEREEIDEDDATFTRGEDSTNQGQKLWCPSSHTLSHLLLASAHFFIPGFKLL